MHIVHVGVFHRTETLDGRTRAVSAYMRHQRDLGHEVTMVRLRPPRPGEPPQDYSGVRQIQLQPPRPSPRLGREIARLFRENRLGGDIYHFHSSLARHWAAARLLPVPYVVSPHGAYVESDMAQHPVRSLVFKLTLGRPHLRKAAFVHAITTVERDALLAYAGRIAVEVLPNAVDGRLTFDPERRLETRARLGVPPNRVLAFYLGRLDVFGKGLDVLADGLRLASSRGSNPLMVAMAGTPWGKIPTDQLVDEASRDRIRILPPALGDEKRDLMSAADLFVTLSRWDVMPTAVLDALGSGLPLLVTKETGFADFVRSQDAGAVVDLNASEVADALLTFAPSDHATRRRIYDAAAKAFDAREIAKRFLALYEAAIEAKPSGIATRE